MERFLDDTQGQDTRHTSGMRMLTGLFCHMNRSLLPYDRSLLTLTHTSGMLVLSLVCKRDLFVLQKRPAYVAKEIYSHCKRPIYNAFVCVRVCVCVRVRVCVCVCVCGARQMMTGRE